MRRSIFRSVSKQEMEKIVRDSKLLTDVIVRFGLKPKGTGNYRTLRQILCEYKIDYSHMIENRRLAQNSSLVKKNKRPTCDILVSGSNCHRRDLKRRLIGEGLLGNKCYTCGQIPEWQGRPLVMVLDHINGVSNDNRLENLRMLCPNCNSQTDTFSGRNLKLPLSVGHTCPRCGERKATSSLMCKKCWWKSEERRKVKNRPSVDILEKQVKELGWEATGRKYGVSGVSVRKWLKGR